MGIREKITNSTPAMKGPMKQVIVAGVSGGPDSSYLLHKILLKKEGARTVAGHMNYGLRGTDSEKDQKLVEEMARIHDFEKEISRVRPEPGTEGGGKGRKRLPAGFEKNARDSRYRFLRDLAKKVGAKRIMIAHTADDQVETVLMRMFEGAGIKGLKGIPRVTEDGIERPILDVWKEDIVKYLNKNNIPFRIDRSNFDTRFERNWVRHVLIPLLVKRYGKALKKRLFTLGERFREIDDYLEEEAVRWIRKNAPRKDSSFGREAFSGLPTLLRMRILQDICFGRLGVAPNERLLEAMDRCIRRGGPSTRVAVGKESELVNRYDEAAFLCPEWGTPGKRGISFGEEKAVDLHADLYSLVSGKKFTSALARRLSVKGDAEVFDAGGLRFPLAVTPLRAGDRIRPFGQDGEKKVKEILIDRKVPRDERWGRPVVRDAEGAILWIPGVLRSGHAPVTKETEKAVLLKIARAPARSKPHRTGPAPRSRK
jgi:tRNA(Ile)-lysidine synthetase-like protein